jgi:hypothetical protein
MEFICLRTFLRIARVEKARNEHIFFIGKPEGRGQLWRRRLGWEDIIKATMEKKWGVRRRLNGFMWITKASSSALFWCW